MIQRIIRFSAENRFLVIAATLVLLAYSVYTMRHIPLDALPDLSDTQVIVYSRWDRSPDIIEDQVTYPITTALLGAPKVKAIRGFSDFGFSYVYVIFEDGTDPYWARTRVLEYLSKITRPAPGRREDRARARRHQRGLGLPVRAGGPDRNPELRRAALLPGLVPALRRAVGARRGGGGHGGRPGAPVPDHREPHPAGRLQAPARGGDHRGAQGQQRRGRAARRALRPRVHGARPRLREVDRRPREARAPVGGRHAHPGEGRRHGGARARRCAGASPTWTARATWWAASW